MALQLADLGSQGRKWVKDGSRVFETKHDQCSRVGDLRRQHFKAVHIESGDIAAWAFMENVFRMPTLMNPS